MSEVLLSLVKGKNLGELFARHMNFTDQPRRMDSSKVMERSWQRVGRHLRGAMTDYGKSKETVSKVEHKQKHPAQR